ncbi:MAG: hypothetical protein R6V57_04110 [Vicinamibacterales bacterium]
MTYRINTSRDSLATRIAFEGLLDHEAVDAVLSLAAAARRDGMQPVHLVLGEGSAVDGDCLPRLRAIDTFTVEAASPFLAYWLHQAGIRTNPSKESS